MVPIKSFIFEWRFVILVILIVLLMIFTHWQRFKTKAYALMLQAEKIAKDDARNMVLTAGPDKEAWVAQRLYILFPAISVFIPEVFMRSIVHWLFIKGKDLVDDGDINGSFKDGDTPAVEPIKPLPNVIDELKQEVLPADANAKIE